MADAVNQWKDELDKAATNYASNHKDSEVRRMFGHHYRSFVDGAIWENDRKSERIKALEEALEPFKKLAIEVSNNRFIGDLNRNEVLYAYNKAEIKLIDLSEVLDVLNPIK